jgi:hypothetical protein
LRFPFVLFQLCHVVGDLPMSQQGTSLPKLRAAAIGGCFVVTLLPAFAQRGGGGHGKGARPVICIYDCPDLKTSIDDKDEARIARLMAVQASADQDAAFVSVTQVTQKAKQESQNLRDLLQKGAASGTLARQCETIEDTLQKARLGNRNFVASFTATQESGLKDNTRKLIKADADLDREVRTLDHVLDPNPDSRQVAAAATGLDRALTVFQNEQLALGAAMSVVLPSDAPEQVFALNPVTNSIELAGQSLALPSAGAIKRNLAADNSDNFSLRFVADLSDLQDDITPILHAGIDHTARCGERVEIQQAALFPQAPAGMVVTHLHFERWICPAGPSSATELAESEGSIEIKLTPSLDPKGELRVSSVVGRVEAEGVLRDALISGELGTNLRDQVTATMLAVVQKAAEVRNTLPAVAQNSATLQRAQFKDAGTGHLSLVLDGDLRLSGEQTKEFAAQLKQHLSAQGTPPR